MEDSKFFRLPSKILTLGHNWKLLMMLVSVSIFWLPSEDGSSYENPCCCFQPASCEWITRSVLPNSYPFCYSTSGCAKLERKIDWQKIFIYFNINLTFPIFLSNFLYDTIYTNLALFYIHLFKVKSQCPGCVGWSLWD